MLILFVLGLNIGCDQVSKSIIRNNLNYYDHISFINDHFALTKIENTGAFLSLGDSFPGPVKFIVLKLLPLLAICFGLWYILNKASLNKTTLFGIVLIIGGGIGNIYDRIVHGSVTDFMHIKFGLFQTGIFNIADVSIMAGMFIVLIHAYFKKPLLSQNY